MRISNPLTPRGTALVSAAGLSATVFGVMHATLVGAFRNRGGVPTSITVAEAIGTVIATRLAYKRMRSFHL